MTIPELNDPELSNQPSSVLDALAEESREIQPLQQEFVLSELVRQIPAIALEEATPLSQMITDQLRKWIHANTKLTFRRTKICEQISQASVTIIDFECSSHLQPRTGYFFREQPRQVRYTSTLVTSEIHDPDHPDRRLACLWAPAYDGKEGTVFSKEAEHLLSVFRQCLGDEREARYQFVQVVALTAIKPLFEERFSRWEEGFGCADAAVQRACAWGVVAAKSREIEYRLFAACLSAFLNFEVRKHLRGDNGPGNVSSVEHSENDLNFALVPVMRIGTVEVGIRRPTDRF